MKKRLAAFDFDHTIVNKNTDLVARDLIQVDKIPAEVSNLYKQSGWIPYMQAIFNILYSNAISKDQILNAIAEIPEVPGILKAIDQLCQMNFHVIIISDSNSVFIEKWCNENGLIQNITETFTNKAQFNTSGKLEIVPFHHQTDCQLSSENLCKGKVLEDFIDMQKHKDIYYDTVFYIGDGQNDVCPALRLKLGDYACARIGYKMEKDLDLRRISKTSKLKLNAEIIRWSDGNDLITQINSILEQNHKTE